MRNKLAALIMMASISSGATFAGQYSTDVEFAYENAKSNWQSQNTTNKGGFRGVEEASLKDSYLWSVFIDQPEQVSYLKGDNSTYRMRFNTTGPSAAQLLRSSPDSNMKGYLVGY